MSLDDGRRMAFGLIISVNRRVIEDFFVEEDGMMTAKVQGKIGFDDGKFTAVFEIVPSEKRGCRIKAAEARSPIKQGQQKSRLRPIIDLSHTAARFTIHLFFPFERCHPSLDRSLMKMGM